MFKLIFTSSVLSIPYVSCGLTTGLEMCVFFVCFLRLTKFLIKLNIVLVVHQQFRQRLQSAGDVFILNLK